MTKTEKDLTERKWEYAEEDREDSSITGEIFDMQVAKYKYLG